MPHMMLFEIWEDAEHDSVGMWPVSEPNDELRRKIAPNSVLRHTFRAKSDFDAYQLNHDWHGWGQWKPEPDWIERLFTAEEVAAQDRYLVTRNGG